MFPADIDGLVSVPSSSSIKKRFRVDEARMYTKALERGGEIPSSSPRLKNYRSALGSLFDYG